ncbi:MAG TPA: ANTAR domain-containing protein, partial [Jatrophihabitantaceae bacterium]|nr:ANTAR domain-containing protein [Jatrophihabitantaceae bacterium]
PIGSVTNGVHPRTWVSSEMNDLLTRHVVPAWDEAGPIDWSRVDDLRDDERWPEFATKASELGIRSVLAVPLMTTKGILGALNLYAHAPAAFDNDAETIASVFATHAAIALFHVELEANLRMGLSTREEIGRAVGILMERHRVSAARAFDMLVVASQRSHRKLRYIALWVNETGEDPASLVRGR